MSRVHAGYQSEILPAALAFRAVSAGAARYTLAIYGGLCMSTKLSILPIVWDESDRE
jgi:hypothetical protein